MGSRSSLQKSEFWKLIILIFHVKKLKKIIFDIENFGTFWHLPINPILKIQ